jgi:hypothetical protein
MIYKTINTKLKIEQPEPTKTEVNTGSLTGKAVPASLTEPDPNPNTDYYILWWYFVMLS